jgi:uncharacterized membrane protein
MPAMQTRNPVSSANLVGHPMHPILITLPIGLFVAVFLFDLVFWQTGNQAFATGSLWLLGAGLIGAALAATTGLIDFLGDRRIRADEDRNNREAHPERHDRARSVAIALVETE